MLKSIIYIIHNGGGLNNQMPNTKTHQNLIVPGHSILTHTPAEGPATNRTMAARCNEFNRNVCLTWAKNASSGRMGWEHVADLGCISVGNQFTYKPIRILVNFKGDLTTKKIKTKTVLYKLNFAVIDLQREHVYLVQVCALSWEPKPASLHDIGTCSSLITKLDVIRLPWCNIEHPVNVPKHV